METFCQFLVSRIPDRQHLAGKIEGLVGKRMVEVHLHRILDVGGRLWQPEGGAVHQFQQVCGKGHVLLYQGDDFTDIRGRVIQQPADSADIFWNLGNVFDGLGDFLGNGG